MQQEMDVLKRDHEALTVEHSGLIERHGQQKVALDDAEARNADLQRRLEATEMEMAHAKADLSASQAENCALLDRVRAQP